MSLAPKKLSAADDFIPKLIPSDTSFAKPETAIPINSPPSPAIGPPLKSFSYLTFPIIEKENLCENRTERRTYKGRK